MKIDKHWTRVAFALAAIGLLVASASEARAAFTNDLLATDLNTGTVFAFDQLTGASHGSFATVVNPRGIAIGPDGNVYVNSSVTNNILKYSGTTGALLSTFVPSGDHGLGLAYGMQFGPNGQLYVASFTTNNILEYNGSTGAFIQAIGAGSPLTGPAGISFGPDGNLYVAGSTSGPNGEILRFNPNTGAYIGLFGPPVLQISGLAFGGGHLFVAAGSPGSSAIGVLDATTGAFQSSLNDSAHLLTPGGLAVGSNGNLFAASYGNSRIVSYTVTGGGTLAFNSSFTAPGLSGPIYLAVLAVPEPSSVALMGIGAFGLAGFALRRKSRSAA